MSYTDFLDLLKQNTGNKLNEYKHLCRFCLAYQPCGIDISENVCNHKQKQQRDAVLNSYIIITKQYLAISDEYPKYVCTVCEANLSQYAIFAQQIEQNAENWEIFLKNGIDVKDSDEFNQMPVNEIEEIKIEYFDESYDNNVPHTDTNIFPDAMEPTMVKVETYNDMVRLDNITGIVKEELRKIGYNEPRPKFVSLSTEYERTCRLCDEPTFCSLTRFYKHQEQYHPKAKSFICDICNSRFKHKYRIVAHMKDRHAKWGKKYQCQFCAKLFYSDREVKGHERLHVNARSYVCNLCGKGFNQKTTLNVHLKSKAHSANYKTKPYKKKPKPINGNKNNLNQRLRCNLCIPSSVFSTPEERTFHRNEVHRKFECTICKNAFMTQESLDSHKLTHSDKPRPFVCKECGATFNQSSHLTSHFKRKHTDEKTFHCPDCDKSFFESCELNSHVRLVHKKQKRVKCDECDIDFATKKYLQKHILLKHSTVASPYDCKKCGKRTESGVKLDQHRMKYHKELS